MTTYKPLNIISADQRFESHEKQSCAITRKAKQAAIRQKRIRALKAIVGFAITAAVCGVSVIKFLIQSKTQPTTAHVGKEEPELSPIDIDSVTWETFQPNSQQAASAEHKSEDSKEASSPLKLIEIAAAKTNDGVHVTVSQVPMTAVAQTCLHLAKSTVVAKATPKAAAQTFWGLLNFYHNVTKV